jgi:hypothetical protein
MTRVFKFFKHIVITLALLILLVGCAKHPTEALLLENIEQMQRSGESRDVSGLLEHIAEDFSGQNGSMDRAQLRAFLTGIRLRTQNIGVTRSKTDVSIQGTRAKVDIHMLVTDGGQYLPSTGRLVQAQTQWRFANGQWQLASANWEEGLQ